MDIFLTVFGIAVGSLVLFVCGLALVGGLCWALSWWLSREEMATYGNQKGFWPGTAGVVRHHEEETGGFHEAVQAAKAGLAKKRSYRRAA